MHVIRGDCCGWDAGRNNHEAWWNFWPFSGPSGPLKDGKPCFQLSFGAESLVKDGESFTIYILYYIYYILNKYIYIYYCSITVLYIVLVHHQFFFSKSTMSHAVPCASRKDLGAAEFPALFLLSQSNKTDAEPTVPARFSAPDHWNVMTLFSCFVLANLTIWN